MARARNWCWTLNNYTEEDEVAIRAWSGSTYTLYGRELGDAQQTPHLQGYTEFSSAMRLSAVRSLHPRIHWEVRRGTQEQASEYCKKDGDFVEIGCKKRQGKRTDIAQLYDKLEDGARMADVLDLRPNYQNIRIGEKYLSYREEGRSQDPIVWWLHGATGTGKTREARKAFPNAWFSSSSLRWWDGYDGHAAIVLDDFRRDFCTFHCLLRILDRYPFRVEFKGGSRSLIARFITITCPYNPRELWERQTDEEIGQLERRITFSFEFPAELKEYTMTTDIAKLLFE